MLMSRSLFYASVGWAAAVLAGGAGVSVQGQNPQLAQSLFLLAMLSGSLVAVLLVAVNLKVRSSSPREPVTAADHAAVLGRLERMIPGADDGIVAELPANGQLMVVAAAAGAAGTEPVAATAAVTSSGEREASASVSPDPSLAAEDDARHSDAVSADDEPAAREALIDALLALRGEQLLDAVEVIASSTPLAQRPIEHEPDIPMPEAVAAEPNGDRRSAPAATSPAGQRAWQRLARARSGANSSIDSHGADEIVFGPAGDDRGTATVAQTSMQRQSSTQSGR